MVIIVASPSTIVDEGATSLVPASEMMSRKGDIEGAATVNAAMFAALAPTLAAGHRSHRRRQHRYIFFSDFLFVSFGCSVAEIVF